MKIHGALAISVGLVVVLLGVVVVQLALHQRQSDRLKVLELRSEFLAEELPYINASIAAFAITAGSTPKRISYLYYPMVVAIGEEVCVRLRADAPSLGPSPVYCYDGTSGVPTRHWNQVDK
jgi:hypothetical protein